MPAFYALAFDVIKLPCRLKQAIIGRYLDAVVFKESRLLAKLIVG